MKATRPKTKPTPRPKPAETEAVEGVTTMALTAAYVESLKRVNADASLTSATTSAGTILEPGKKGERHGLQVFVKVIRYSDAWLKRAPHNGGLSVRP